MLALSGCNPTDPNKVEVTLKHPNGIADQIIPFNITVSNIQVINHQIIITGTNLTNVTTFKINEGTNLNNLQIESKTSTSIVANTLANVSFAAGKVFNFILSNASAASTFTVNFSLCDSTLGGKSFACTLTPNDRDVLSYNAGTGKWEPRSINGLSYQGVFSAAAGIAPVSNNIGDYYIISVAGTIAGVTYHVHDWIVLSSIGDWEKIDNSNTLTSVFGRTGIVTATKNDYSLTQMSDVDLTTVVPVANQSYLKWNGTNWVPGTVSVGSSLVVPTCSAGQVLKGDGTNLSCVADQTGAAAFTGTINQVVLTDGTTGALTTTGSISKTELNLLSGISTPLATQAYVASQASILSPLAGSTSITTLGAIASGTWNGTTIAVANGGTGSTTAPLARTALGIGSAGTGTIGSFSTNIPILGTGGIVGTKLCAGDNAGGIICAPMTSSIVAGSVSDKSGTGALLFGTTPTITNPVITNIAPSADFTLTQNAVAPFTSVNTGAVANTLYLLKSINITKNFPKEFKYTLGEKLKNELMELIVLIYRANSESDRLHSVKMIAERIQVIELLIRLSQDLKLISKTQYANLVEMTQSLGKQTQGWVKSLSKN